MKKSKIISLLATMIMLSSLFMFYPLKVQATEVSYVPEVLGQWFS